MRGETTWPNAFRTVRAARAGLAFIIPSPVGTGEGWRGYPLAGSAGVRGYRLLESSRFSEPLCGVMCDTFPSLYWDTD